VALPEGPHPFDHIVRVRGHRLDRNQLRNGRSSLRYRDRLAGGNVVETTIEVSSGVVRADRSHPTIVAVGDVETVHRFNCPVCGYPDLYDEPRPSFGGGSYEICPSCGFQFEVSDDDVGLSFEEWRSSWVEREAVVIG
jgi:predicted RNA-binding Zn-ribbon protein involved in translation (DUF1610 family)